MNIKKTLPAALAAAAMSVLQSAIAPAALADTETVGGIVWTYSLSNGEATIGAGEWRAAIPSDTAGDIVVPSTLGGCPVTEIGYAAFVGLYHVGMIEIHEGVKKIGKRVFNGSSITNINVAKDNTNYASHEGVLFDKAGTTLLAYPKERTGDSYAIPDGVTAIDEYAFYNSRLSSVTFPSTLREIGDGSFDDCYSLANMILPEGLESIGSYAFYGCPLQTLSIPSTVRSLDGTSFGGNSSLATITVAAGNEWYRVEDGVLFNSAKTEVIKYPPKRQGTAYAIPETVKEVAHCAFSGCSLESISIPEGVEYLGWCSFSWSAWKDITIPGTVTNMDNYVFQGCQGLTNAVISSGVKFLTYEFFYGCTSLESVTIPDSMTRVESEVFRDCSALATMSIPYALSGQVSNWGLPGSCEVVVRDALPLVVETTEFETMIPNAQNNSFYRWFTLSASGGLAPYTWRLADGSRLPGSGGVSSSGSFNTYLMTSNFGANTFDVIVTDAEGTEATATITLTVSEDTNKMPVIESASPERSEIVLSVGDTMTFSVEATDEEDETLTYWWSVGDMQNGWSHVASTGYTVESRYVFGPLPEGRYQVTLSVTDGRENHDASRYWYVTVKNIPVIDTDELPEATEGTEYTATLEAHGGVAPYTWSVLPSGYSVFARGASFADVGVAQGWNADDSVWTLNLPFSFPFAGGSYSKAKVSSNGFIYFGNNSEDSWYESYKTRAIVVFNNDLRTDIGDCDIFVDSSDDAVTIRWHAVTYDEEYPVDASATLYANGKIVIKYDSSDGYSYSIDARIDYGDGKTIIRASDAGDALGGHDIVFLPAALPEGLELSEDGVLSGTPADLGEYTFSVAVTGDNGESATMSFTLTVAENAALRPAIVSAEPEPGYVNMGVETEQPFAVEATHPTDGAVEIEWLLDGESVATGATFDYVRDADDTDLHTIRCVVSAADLPKTAVREWKVGTLTISDPESTTVSYGQNVRLSVDVVSSLPATVTWLDGDTDEELGTGETLALRNVTASRNVKAVATSALGAAESAIAAITVDPAPTVGRIFKMSGPAFAGNRLVLRAKTYGDPTGATFAWKRDGVTVATTERLDISALAAADFGTYTFTMTNPHGTATTEPFVLEEAKSGVPYGWGASEHGRTTAPEGLSRVAQIASGMNFNLGLKTDGTVAAWGYDGHGGCDVPEGLADVSFVAAGGYESQGAGFAVKTDGSVVAWGQPAEIGRYRDWYWEDDYDEYGNWIGDHQVFYWHCYTNGWDTVATMPADLSDVVQVAVGGDFAIALKADGSVVTWGGRGYWDDGDNWIAEPYAVPGWRVKDAVAIAAGSRFCVALLADGTVEEWGRDIDEYGICEVPDGLSDVVSVAATKSRGGSARFAIDAGGTLHKWGDDYGDTGYESGTMTDAAAVDCGQYLAAALSRDGSVSVLLEWNSYGVRDIPAAVQGNALGIAAGGYHCTAILPDADGDSIADAEELLLGRDPEVYEDYARVKISGKVSVDGGTPPGGVAVRLYDASGALRARTAADEDGNYAFEGLIPGRYFLKIEAEDAADIWLDGAKPGDGGEAPFSTFGDDRDDVDFDLDPGQAAALVQVLLVGEADDGDGPYTMEDPPSEDSVVYLDMWPTETIAGAEHPGLINIGEVAASHGKGLLPHKITLRPVAEDMTAVPAPVELDGVEGETIDAKFNRNPETGSVNIVTEPAGAEIWIDYADESVGFSPLVVENLAAASHALLIRKEGYLRPRPIQFRVEADDTVEVAVPLADETEPSMSVEVGAAIPSVPIYLDYLPTGEVTEVTPVTITGLDPASHSGVGWASREHSILLRHASYSPFAPRRVPEPEIDPETGDPILNEPASIRIDAPNTYEYLGESRVDLGVEWKELPVIFRRDESATFIWVVTNAGDVAVSGPWNERIVLENSRGQRVLVTQAFSGEIGAGASAVRSWSGTVPWDIASGGSVRVRIDIDPEKTVKQRTGGLPDSASATVRIDFALPDLGVAWTSLPELIVRDATATFAWNVTNAGVAAAIGPWTERIVLANSLGETELARQTFEGNIEAGASAARSWSCVVPWELSAGGAVRVRIDVDSGEEVAQIQPGLPDSVWASSRIDFALPEFAVALTEVPEALPTRGAATLSWSVSNTGASSADAPWLERVWLVDKDGESLLFEEDDGGEPVAKPLFETNIVDSLPAGVTGVRTIEITVDSAWAELGDLWLKVEADCEGAVQRLAGTGPVSATTEEPIPFTTPDLGVEWTSLPELIVRDATATFAWNVTNAGIAAAIGPWTERIVLANSLGERELATQIFEGDLEAGASAARSWSGVIPWELATGGAVRVRIDVNAEGALVQGEPGLPDSAWATSAIGFALPEFAVALTEVPEALPAGGAATLSWSVSNTGASAADSPWLERVWLVGKDGESLLFDKGEEGLVMRPLFETNIVDSLAAGATGVRTVEIAVDPAWVEFGNLWLKVEADCEGAIQRLHGTSPVSVTTEEPIPFMTPDLGVAWTSLPETLPIGGEATYGYIVTNGGAAATYAQWVERVWVDLGAESRLVGETTATAMLEPGEATACAGSVTAQASWLSLGANGAMLRVQVDPNCALVQAPNELVDEVAAESSVPFMADGFLLAIHSGDIADRETWGADKVHLVVGTVNVLYGATLTIEPDAIVKFLDGARLNVVVGGNCIANGVVFTHVADDTVGGDTMGDGDASRPVAGAYTIAGTITRDDATEERWAPPAQTLGTLSGAQRWRGHNVYRVTGNLTLSRGCTLTIEPGAIVKFNSGVSLTVESGATLDAKGTRISPIYFTSVKDDTVGGDTNGDDDATEAQPGDWRWIRVDGTAKFDYSRVFFNSSYENYGGIDAYGSYSVVTFDNSIAAHSKYELVNAHSGRFTARNSVFWDSSLAFGYYGSGRVAAYNCVFADLTTAIRQSGKTLVNCVFYRCVNFADQYYGYHSTYKNCLFFNPTGFSGPKSFDRVGSNGNVWGDPLFTDPDNGDFRIAKESPCVDAGDSSYAPLLDAFGRPRMDVKSVADKGRQDADGICADIGIYEVDGVPAVPLPNLAVLSVTAPASAKAGDTVTVEYVVTNRGTAVASATVRDTIRLKGDASLGGATIEAGTVTQSYDLPVGGEAVTVTARVTVPGVASGAWTFGVDVNLERDTYEQNLADNRAWAEVATAVAADSLATGVADKTVPGGATVGYALDGLPVEGGAAIITGADLSALFARGAIGAVPTAGGGTAATALPDGSLLVAFPAREDGRTAYLAIENSGAAAARVSIEIVDSAPRLLAVSPARIANEGTTSLTLYGVGLSGATTATLAGRAATAVEEMGSAQLLATFDANGLKTGRADVTAAGATLSGAVEIYTTKMGPKLVAWLDMPSSVRDGRVFAAYVRYRNDGDTAMPMPCFKVYRDRYDYNTLLGLERNAMPTATALHLGGVSPTAPAGVLKPGEEGSVPFYFMPRGSYQLRLEHVVEASSAASAFPAFGGAEGYFEAMSASATRLALRGERAYDLLKCVDLALRVRNGTPCAAATGRLLDAATAAPLAGVGIALVAADAESGLPGATGTTAADGSFVLDGLADGDYRWLLGNGALLDDSATNVFVIAAQADRNGIEVLALPGGRISGHVVCADGVPAANCTVALLDSGMSVAGATETDAFGFFSFAELPDGDWAVQSAPADGWCAALATNLVIGTGARTAEATLTPVRGAVLRGTVALADDTVVTNGFVQAISGEGVAYETSVGADGTWTIPGVPEGAWSVRHYSAALFSPDEDVDLAAGDEVELALVSTERPLFFPTRTVGYGSLETTFVFSDQARAEGVSSWSWDFDSDGNPDSTEAQPTHKYEELGTNTVTLIFVENGQTRTSVYENCVRVEKEIASVLKDGAILFGRNSGTLAAVSMEPGVLVLSGDPESGTLVAGMALMGKCGDDWFCRRIVSAEKTGGQWVLETEFADWGDIYEQYAFSGLFSMADKEPSRGTRGKKALPGENEVSIEGGLRATRSAHPDFSFEIVREMRDGRKYESWAIVGGFVLEGSYSLEGSATYSRTDSVDLEIPFPTGAEEFGVTGKVTAELYTSGSASIKGSFGMSAGIRAGLRIGQETYEGGKRHWLPPLVFDPTYSNPTGDFEGSLSLETGFKAGIKLKFLETASVGVSINPYARTTLSAATSSPASAELVAGVNLVGEANLIDWEFGWFKVKIGAEGTLEGPKATAFKWTGPEPDFSYSPQTCEKAPGTYSFSNNSKGDTLVRSYRKESWQPKSYEWKFGDGSTSEATNPSHTFQEEGTYEVSLKAKGHFITGPYRKKKTVTVGKPDDIPDDGARKQDDSEYDSSKQSWDPNEIAGPKGQGDGRLVAAGQWMDYTIYFENHAGEDVADAQVILITNALPAQLDWTTFEMGDVVFGADDRTDDGLRGKGGASGHWTSEIPIVEGTNVTVKTELAYDADTGQAIWHLRIYDPDGNLGCWPADGSGILPPNDDTHRGEGRITYRVKVRADALPGDTIDAAATIVFDDNPPIPTDPTWRNTVGALHHVVFDANGGEGLMQDVEVPFEGTNVLPASTFTFAGHNFGGWATSASGNVVFIDGATLDNTNGVPFALNGTTTLYAVWTRAVFTATFDANGGQGGATVALAFGSPLAAPAVAREGYTFAGWSPAVPATMPAANVTYIAQWSPTTYTAVFDANGGMGGATLAVAYGSSLVAPTVAREGYIFSGWSPAVPATMPAANATYVAQWTPTTYAVVFNKNGGKLPKGKKMAAQAMTYDIAAKLRKNVFTRKGYVFAGWATSKANAKKGVIAYANAQSASNITAGGGTVTLYAVWAKPKYKVAFYANGGSGTMAVESFAYGKAKKLTANKFKAPKGKKFAGWAKSKSDAKKGKVAYKNKAKVKNLVITGKTVKLYAVWKKK